MCSLENLITHTTFTFYFSKVWTLLNMFFNQQICSCYSSWVHLLAEYNYVLYWTCLSTIQKPIDTEIYKDYCKIIEASISLQEIEGKIESGVYKMQENIESGTEGDILCSF